MLHVLFAMFVRLFFTLLFSLINSFYINLIRDQCVLIRKIENENRSNKVTGNIVKSSSASVKSTFLIIFFLISFT